MTRIGFGYDVHKLVTGRKLILGGVEIPNNEGLLGHSDADVLLHAICDALLGAAALGDIGKHFPDADPKYKNISSLILLENVDGLLSQRGFDIVNIDATVVLEQPKIASYVEAMRTNISRALHISSDAVSIKATTSEKMGFIGSGEGAAAYAVASVQLK
ncbi:MAG: 2-C-methyl-D-erythritol 2,4-cyclodiphosphate synthase [Bacteroidota bacterium]|nr:2-C-methyl-D-erythritol 2,4-cyclodiphosphate synthase [Bacteroidota bacterium]